MQFTKICKHKNDTLEDMYVCIASGRRHEMPKKKKKKKKKKIHKSAHIVCTLETDKRGRCIRYNKARGKEK